MDRDTLHSLYRRTMDGLSPSANPTIEALRLRWARGELATPEISPKILMDVEEKDENWGTHAFRHFERNGFVEHDYRRFLWRDAKAPQTGRNLDVLAAIETAALLRAQRTDLGKVQSELDHRHAEIVQAAEGCFALPVVMAIQRYFTTLVGSLGTMELMVRYANANKVSVCYAWAQQLQASDIDDLGDWMLLLPEILAGKDRRKAASLCQAIKSVPFGAYLPDLAAA